MKDVVKTTATDPLPRAVTLVNKLPVQTFLRAYADREDGSYHDPDVRWNNLMHNRQFGNYYPGNFASSRTYQGSFFAITYDDGTSETIKWTASAKLKKAVTFSEDLYRQECILPTASKKRDEGMAEEEPQLLPIEPFSYNPFSPNATTTSESTSPTSTSFSLTGKPAPKLSIPKVPTMEAYSQNFRVLRTELSALASTYIIPMPKKKSFGVLAIHSFSSKTTAEVKAGVLTNQNKPLTSTNVEQEFTKLVKDSIALFKAQGITQVIIDVTGNGGGTIGLGYDVAKQFFPNHIPYAGTNLRASTTLKVFYTYLKGTVSSFDFTDDSERDSDGKTKFKSAEYIYGPIKGYLGNSFTRLIRRYPQAMINFPTAVKGNPPFLAKNVVL
ncbi:MAG: hypothetical protein Q9187_009503, partial [Circinaria calcarea]